MYIKTKKLNKLKRKKYYFHLAKPKDYAIKQDFLNRCFGKTSIDII